MFEDNLIRSHTSIKQKINLVMKEESIFLYIFWSLLQFLLQLVS